ncbi:MAG: autotransporter outer membrane beta-barrel domain-containing protein [Gammaproteobacteria bacterium]|nr:autotransporter outer membrane beta-barrel domain-containing protein [Gammaproteobacteria bacterium]
MNIFPDGCWWLSVSSLSMIVLSLMTISTAQADLREIPGQNEVQSGLADAIQTVVCPDLFIAGVDINGSDPDAQLFRTCNAMIHTSNENQGTGPTGNSLGISDAELLGALQDIAHEEAITQGTMATETSSAQQVNIGVRISELLGRVPSVSLAGLRYKMDGRQVKASSLGFSSPQNIRGGAAGDVGSAGSKLGGFVNGVIGFGDKDQTDREDGFDFNTYGISAGVDYRFTNNFVLGLAGGYSNLDVDIKSTTGRSGGDVEADGYSISAYGLYYLDKFYFNGVVGYGSNDYDTSRRVVIPSESADPLRGPVDATASATTDSDQISLAGTVGYEFSRDAMTFGPYLRGDYLDVDIDGYTESGAGGLNLVIDKQSLKSLTSTLGGQLSYSFSQNFGIVVPHGRLEWIHEFEDASRSISARYLHNVNNTFWTAPSDDPDRDYFTLGIGVSTVFQSGVQAFLDYQTLLAKQDINEHVFTLGGRYEF